MNTPWTEKPPYPLQPGSSFWWLLGGTFFGVLFLLGMQLPRKWFAFLFLAVMGGIASLAVDNKKDYYLVLFSLVLPVWIGKHFYFTRAVYGISTFGFPVHFSLIPLTALYVIWFIRSITRTEPAPVSTRGLIALAGVLIAATVACMGSHDQFFASFDLFALATSMLIFVYVSSDLRKLREVQLILVLLVFSGGFQWMIAVAQYLTGSTLGLEYFGTGKTLYGYAGLEAVSRVSGLVGNPNHLAMFIGLVLPLSVSLLFTLMSGRTRFFLIVAVFFEVAGLGVTFSRGGIIGSGLGITAVVIFHLSRRMGLTRALFMTFASALLLAVFLVVVPNPIYKGLTRTEETAYGRWPLAKIAATMISHHPLFGIGLNNFTHASRQYDFTPEQISAAWNSPVHNLFLFIAGEIGLVGLTCFLIFILRVVTALTPALRSLDPFILSVGTGLIFSLMAFFIHAQVDYSIWTQNRPFWLLLGLSVSVGRFAKSAPLVASPGLP